MFLVLSVAGSEDKWKLLCMVRGYHFYKHIWDPWLEDEFTTKRIRDTTLMTSMQWPYYLGLPIGRLTVFFPCSVDLKKAAM